MSVKYTYESTATKTILPESGPSGQWLWNVSSWDLISKVTPIIGHPVYVDPEGNRHDNSVSVDTPITNSASNTRGVVHTSSQALTATSYDQFGNPVETQTASIPSVTYSMEQEMDDDEWFPYNLPRLDRLGAH